MSRSVLTAVLRHAAGLAGPAEPDADLLGRFVADRDEPAFAELVRRHGPMVWAACRHLLPDHADAEDAFQATFLALCRSAGTIRHRTGVGGWLHGVAVKAATKLKRGAARRRQREQRSAVREGDRPVPEATWDSLLTAVHEEVRRLPDPLRAAFVLCDLEGVGQPDAAARLGWKPGTLTGRLCRARQVLLARLTSRGLAPAAAGGGVGLGVAAAGGSVPAVLVSKVMSLTTAGGAVPPALVQLVREVTPMTLARTKLLAAVVLAGGLTAGAGWGLLPGVVAQPPGAEEPSVPTLIDPVGGEGEGPVLAGPQDPELPPPKRPTPKKDAPPKGGGPAGGPPGAPPGAGGMPGGPPGMGMGMPGMGGMMGGGPAPPAWEYRFETLKSWDRGSFEKLLSRNGNDGWEYAGSESFVHLNPSDRVLVFKRRKGGNVIAGGMMGPAGGGGVGGMASGQFGGGSMGPGGFGGGGGMMVPPGGNPFGGGGLGAPMPGFGGPPSTGGFPGGGTGFGPPGGSPGSSGGGNRGGGGGRGGLGGSEGSGGRPGGGDEGGGRATDPRLAEREAAVAEAREALTVARERYQDGAPVLDRLQAKLKEAEDRLNNYRAPLAPAGSAGGGGASGMMAGGPPPADAPKARAVTVLKLRNAPAADLAVTVKAVFSRENIQLTAEPRTNSLIVRADDRQLAEVKALLKELDVPDVAPPTPMPGPGAGGGPGLPSPRPGGGDGGLPTPRPKRGPVSVGDPLLPPPGLGGGPGDPLLPPGVGGGLGDPLLPPPGVGAPVGGGGPPLGLPAGGPGGGPVPDPLPSPVLPPAGGSPGEGGGALPPPALPGGGEVG